MKKNLNSIPTGLIILLLFFSACDGTGDDGTSSDVTETLAAATVYSGYLPYMLNSLNLSDGTYDSSQNFISSGTLVVSDSGNSFVFTDCFLHFDDGDDAFDVEVNGSFTIFAVNDTTDLFTLTDFYIGNVEGSESGTVSGSHLISTTVWSADLTITGVTSGAHEIVLEITMVDSGDGPEPSEVVSATLDGEDFSAELTAFLNDM